MPRLCFFSWKGDDDLTKTAFENGFESDWIEFILFLEFGFVSRIK